MCGRYYIAQEDNDEEIARIIAELNKTPGAAAAVHGGEIFPSQLAPVIVNTPEGWQVRPMRWGFSRVGGSGLCINSRSETAHVLPLFAEAVEKGRCLVPMSGFYEWRRAEDGAKTKEKYAFSQADGHAMFLAGICTGSGQDGRFSILTRAADEQMSPYHHRMPVILGTRRQRHGWLFSPQSTAYAALQTLFQPPLLAVERVKNSR